MIATNSGEIAILSIFTFPSTTNVSGVLAILTQHGSFLRSDSAVVGVDKNYDFDFGSEIERLVLIRF